MRIISKYQKLNQHALHAKLKTASHRFALMVDNYSPDDTEAQNGLLMVTGKVFVPGYTDATVTIVYPKQKRSTDQSFYYITPTESTEDMSLAYSDDTFYPRFSECEQAVKDLPEVTVSQYFYDKGIIPDDPNTFTALTGIPLESSLVNDINEITGEDANYYTIGAVEEHSEVDNLIKSFTDYQDGDQIIPYLDITGKFFNNGTPTLNMRAKTMEFIAKNYFVSPSDFYNSLTIILRKTSEHPELNTDVISNSDEWCITVTSTFIPTIMNYGFGYSESYWSYDLHDRLSDLVRGIAADYMYSLYSSLDEWASLVINEVLQIESIDMLPRDLYDEYHNVCSDGNPWTYKNYGEFTINTRDLEGFTPVEGLESGDFHFVLHSDSSLEESLSHFRNPAFLNENPNDNQLYLSNLPNLLDYDTSSSNYYHLYSTVYFASNKKGREIVFLHLPDTLMSGCLDTAPSWTTLNYLKTQGQQLMNCLQETILSLSNDDETEDPNAVDDDTVNEDSDDLMSHLVALGWEQQTPTTILSPSVEASGEYDHTSVKLQFSCVDNIWSLSSLIVSCEASGGEVPLPLSDAQLNEDVTSEGIEGTLESIVRKGNSELNWNNFRSNSSGDLLANGSSHDNDRGLALYAARLMNRDIYNLSTIDPELRTSIPYEDIDDVEYAIIDDPRVAEWVYRILEAFNLPHSFEISDNFNTGSGYLTLENKDYTILFDKNPEEPLALSVAKYYPNRKRTMNVPVGYEEHYVLWSDLFNGTPYADFNAILPGVGAVLTLLYVFSQPLLDDPQILNNIQRIINNNELTLEQPQVDDDGNQENWQNVDESYWLGQVEERMDQSQVFTRISETMWARSTDPIIINGIDYSQQIVGEIIVEADPLVEEMRVRSVIRETDEAADLTKYDRSLIPAPLTDILPDISTENVIEVSAEKVNTLIGNNVLNGVLTVEQLTALEENTNDILPWLTNSSAQRVKTLQKVAGWVQYCDKILNDEEIPSLDFISQGLHGNILNLLYKNKVTGNTGINYFLQTRGAVPIKEIYSTFDMKTGSVVSHAAYDVCKYYAFPVKVNGWDNIYYCALTFTKQNGKPVCQLQDDCLYKGKNGVYFHSVVHDTGAHLTTLGETFNSMVTAEGLPNYNLLRFLQEQLGDGLQATDAAVQMLEENKDSTFMMW